MWQASEVHPFYSPHFPEWTCLVLFTQPPADGLRASLMSPLTSYGPPEGVPGTRWGTTGPWGQQNVWIWSGLAFSPSGCPARTEGCGVYKLKAEAAALGGRGLCGHLWGSRAGCPPRPTGGHQVLLGGGPRRADPQLSAGAICWGCRNAFEDGPGWEPSPRAAAVWRPWPPSGRLTGPGPRRTWTGCSDEALPTRLPHLPQSPCLGTDRVGAVG